VRPSIKERQRVAVGPIAQERAVARRGESCDAGAPADPVASLCFGPRVAVEHRLGRIQASQTDRARYKGTRKNTFDLRRHAALANLIEIQAALAA
jgi:hypothetical protein